jgi:hypothetical protein
MKIGGTNKGKLEERRERNKKKKKKKKWEMAWRGFIKVMQKQEGRAEK